MKVATRGQGDVGIVDLTGDLDSFIDVNAFHDAIKQLLAAGSRHVLVNLGGVGYVSSPGLGALMSGVASLHQAGGTLKLIAPGERVRTLLNVTRLAELFEIYDDEGAGLASFAGG
jgi:anti-sigma B factor antagonist